MPAMNPGDTGSNDNNSAAIDTVYAQPKATKKTAAKKSAPAKKAPASKHQHVSSSDGYNARTWAIALLERIGAPASHQNIHAIVAWEAGEGGHWQNTATYNPLDTTQDAAGASSMNSVGVKSYSSWEEGLNATAQTLQNGLYQPILDALRTGHDAQGVAQAVVGSPWGTHHINLSADYSTYGHGGTSGGGGGTVSGSGGGASVVGNKAYQKAVSQYGFLAGYLNDPEIGPLIKNIAKYGWDPQTTMQHLEKTNFWKTHSDSARTAGALQQTDPATYQQNWKQEHTYVSSLATGLGLNIGKDRLDQLTTTAIFSGWTDLQLKKALAAEFHYDPHASYLGEAGSTVQKFKALSNEYLVPLSDHTVQQWTRRTLAGVIQPDDYQGYLAEQAKSMFPWMAKQIDQGINPQQFLDPYRQAAAQTLNVNAADVNFMDPKWRNVFETIDPKTGERSERGIANATTLMRTDPKYGYDFTPQARQDAASLGEQIAQEFGYSA